MQSAPSRPTFLEGPADAYTGSGMASGSSCFPQQRVSPLTFAAGLPMSIGGARARAPYTTNGLYNAATAAAAVSLLFPARACGAPQVSMLPLLYGSGEYAKANCAITVWRHLQVQCVRAASTDIPL